VALSEGTWETQPSKHGLRELLRSIFPPPADEDLPPSLAMLTRLKFEEPGEDAILVAEATVRPRHWHCETVRDDIVEALLASFQPEYESMVEVEVIE
jgi:hypothetical protein